jgi:hypothetical protein
MSDVLARLRKARVAQLAVGDVTVHIREISAREAFRYTQLVQQDPPPPFPALMGAIVGAALSDEEGNRLVPEGQEAQVEDLPMNVLRAAFAAALKHNGLGDPEAAAKAAEGN